MRRVMSTLVLSAWAGFTGLAGLWHGWQTLGGVTGAALDEALASRSLSFVTVALPGLHDWAPVAQVPGLLSALACLSASGLMFGAIDSLHLQKEDAVANGEKLAVAGLLLSAATALLARLCDVAIEPLFFGQYLISCLAAALGALAFDRLVAIDEAPEDDEAAFRASVVLIADQMARQTRLYTLQHSGERSVEPLRVIDDRRQS